MNKIIINGYKSIRKLELELRSINILIGANGSGKSNFLSFFDFLKNIYSRNLQEYVALKGGIDKFLYQGTKITTEISTHLKFPNTNGYSFTLKAGDESFIFSKEGLWYGKNPYVNNPTDIASVSTESNLRFSGMPRADYIRNYLDALEKYHFHDTSVNSPFTKPSNINTDIFRLYDKGENIASYLYTIKEKNLISYNFIIKTIQSIAPYFKDFVLLPDENGNLRLKWQDKYSSVVYGVNDLSDGTIRFIALAVLFLQPKLPQTIILDEPELGLHPSAITKLAGMIKSASGKDCQIIIATQSTDLISHFCPEDIITVDQIKGESLFRRLESIELQTWLEDYTIDELWKRNIITQGQPNNDAL